MNYSKITKVLISILTVSLLSACTQISSAPPSSAQEEVSKNIRVRLAWLHQAQFAGFYVAEKEGLYKSANLNVDLIEYQDGLDQSQELIDGQVDFSVMSPVEFITSRSKNNTLIAVAAIYQHSPYAFASLKSKKITSPAELRGKVLGEKGGNIEASITYRALLAKYQIDSDEVKFNELDFKMDEGQDLLKNRADIVDLYRTDQTYLLDKQGLEYDLLLPEKYGFDRYGDVLVTTEKMISEDPQTVRKFVQATQSGWDNALKNKEKAVQTTLLFTKNDYSDLERQKYILEQSESLIKPVGGESIGHMQFSTWNNLVQSMENADLLAKPIDVSQSYTKEFLK
jgi:NitT/TauT family transport system substrate-binding protein